MVAAPTRARPQYAPMELLQPLSPLWATRLHIALELAATLAFALSGVIEAARKRLDVVGVAVVAFAAAFGGGTLRDLLLDYRPFFWVQQIEFLWIVLALCAGAMLFMRQRHLRPTERAILWPDAIGLGLFTAIGVDRALALGQPALVAVMMGVVTSVFGGVLRDVLAKLSAATMKVLAKPEVVQQMAEQGAIAHPEKPAEFEAFVKAETAKWGPVVKQSGARVD